MAGGQERRHLNGEIWTTIQQVRADIADLKASLADVRGTIVEVRNDLRMHIKEDEYRRESAPPLIKKLNDLWDWRNRLLGGLALAGILIPVLSVLLDRVIPR